MIKNIWIILIMCITFAIITLKNICYEAAEKVGKEGTFLRLILAVFLSKMSLLFCKIGDALIKYYTALEEGR